MGGVARGSSVGSGRSAGIGKIQGFFASLRMTALESVAQNDGSDFRTDGSDLGVTAVEEWCLFRIMAVVTAYFHGSKWRGADSSSLLALV
jgi:hypothetical protein